MKGMAVTRSTPTEVKAWSCIVKEQQNRRRITIKSSGANRCMVRSCGKIRSELILQATVKGCKRREKKGLLRCLGVDDRDSEWLFGK